MKNDAKKQKPKNCPNIYVVYVHVIYVIGLSFMGLTSIIDVHNKNLNSVDKAKVNQRLKVEYIQ